MQVPSAARSSVQSYPFAAPIAGRDFPPPIDRRTGGEDAVDPLDSIGVVVTVPAGVTLYEEGAPTNSWYKVSSGLLRTCKLLPDGRRQIEDFLFAGDYFGLEAGTEHSLSAEAVTEAAVIRYSRPRIERLSSDHPGLSAQLLRLTLRRLDKATARLLLLGRKTAEEKLVSFLIEMLDRAPGVRQVELPMSRTDIADYLGLTIETVSRVFSSLKQRRIIALPSSRRVVAMDMERLALLTGE